MAAPSASKGAFWNFFSEGSADNPPPPRVVTTTTSAPVVATIAPTPTAVLPPSRPIGPVQPPTTTTVVSPDDPFGEFADDFNPQRDLSIDELEGEEQIGEQELYEMKMAASRPLPGPPRAGPARPPAPVVWVPAVVSAAPPPPIEPAVPISVQASALTGVGDEDDWTSSSGEDDEVKSSSSSSPMAVASASSSIPLPRLLTTSKRVKHRRRPMTQANVCLEKWAQSPSWSLQPLEKAWGESTHLTFVVPNMFDVAPLLQERQGVNQVCVPSYSAYNFILLVLYEEDMDGAWETFLKGIQTRLQRKKFVPEGFEIPVVRRPRKRFIMSKLRADIHGLRDFLEPPEDNEAEFTRYHNIRSLLNRLVTDMFVVRNHICYVPFPDLTLWETKLDPNIVKYYPASFASLSTWIRDYNIAWTSLLKQIPLLGCHGQPVFANDKNHKPFATPDEAKGAQAAHIFDLELPLMCPLEQGGTPARQMQLVDQLMDPTLEDDHPEYAKAGHLLRALKDYMTLLSLIQDMNEMGTRRESLKILPGIGNISQAKQTSFESAVGSLITLCGQFVQQEQRKYNAHLQQAFLTNIRQQLAQRTQQLTAMIQSTQSSLTRVRNTDTLVAERRALLEREVAAEQSKLLAVRDKAIEELRRQVDADIKEQSSRVNNQKTGIQSATDTLKAEKTIAIQREEAELQRQKDKLEVERADKAATIVAAYEREQEQARLRHQAQLLEASREIELSITEAAVESQTRIDSINDHYADRLRALKSGINETDVATLARMKQSLYKDKLILEEKKKLMAADEEKITLLRTAQKEEIDKFREEVGRTHQVYSDILVERQAELNPQFESCFREQVRSLVPRLQKGLPEQDAQQLQRQVESVLDSEIAKQKGVMSRLESQIRSILAGLKK